MATGRRARPLSSAAPRRPFHQPANPDAPLEVLLSLDFTLDGRPGLKKFNDKAENKNGLAWLLYAAERNVDDINLYLASALASKCTFHFHTVIRRVDTPPTRRKWAGNNTTTRFFTRKRTAHGRWRLEVVTVVWAPPIVFGRRLFCSGDD